MRLKVLWNRIIVETEEVKEKTEGGIVIPKTAMERIELAVTRGKVVDKGPEAFKDQDAENLEPVIGDIVVFAKYAGLPIESNGNKYRIMNDIDILAIEKEKK